MSVAASEVEAWRRADEERHQELLRDQAARLRSKVRRTLATFPRFVHAKVGTTAFERAVAPVFARMAELYEPSHGDALILGDSGSGKTSLVDAIADRFHDAVIRHGWTNDWMRSSEWRFLRTAYFISVADLVRAIRGFPLGQGDPPELRRCFTASWLCLDDLANEPPGFEKQILNILDARYRCNGRGHPAPTFVTSGFTKAELEARYGVPCVRRLIETHGAQVEAWR